MMSRTSRHRRFASFAAGFVVAIVVGTTHAQTVDFTQRGAAQDLDAARAELRERIPDGDARDVMLITIEALHPDVIGATAAPWKGSTPHLDRLGADAFRFNDAHSASHRRATAMFSLFYSLYPSTLAGLDQLTTASSVVDQFEDRGFRIHSFFRPDVLDRTTEVIAPGADIAGFDRGNRSKARGLASAIKIVKSAFARRESGQQIFSWINLPFPVAPARYHPGVNYGSAPLDHYRAAVEYADRCLGDLVRTLKSNGTWDTTILVVASPYAIDGVPASEVLPTLEKTDRVPLYIRVPGLKPRTVATPVELVDVVPTILSAVDRGCDFSVQGRSLLPLLLADTDPAESRPVFIERRPRRDEDLTTGRLLVEDKTTRLIYAQRAGQPSTFHDAEGKPLSGSGVEPTLTTSLEAAAESYLVYNHSCLRLWNGGELRVAEKTEVGSTKARARWLVHRGDTRARRAVLDLIDRGDGDLAEAAEFLYAVGTDADVATATGLLSHREPITRALAGAFLCAHGQPKRGLDVARDGLKLATSTDRMRVILDGLSRSKSDDARRAIDALDEVDLAPETRGFRRLALARLGDAAALAALPRHLLDAQTIDDRRPFLDAIVQLRGKDAADLVEMTLSRAAGSAEMTLALLSVLDELDARDAAPTVGVLADALNPRVRTTANELLRKWKSPRGVPELTRLLHAESPRIVDTAFRELLGRPGLLGSPLLPGVRFDQWAQLQPEEFQMASGYPRAAGRYGLSFIHSVTPRKDGNVRALIALHARPDDASVPLGMGDLRVRLRITGSERWIQADDLTPTGALWIWSGTIRGDWLEAGNNRFSIVVGSPTKKRVKVYPMAFVLVPDANDDTPIASLETHPLVPNRGLGDVTSRPDLDFGAFKLWAFSSGSGGGIIAVKAGDETLARLTLRPGENRLSIEIPRRLTVAENGRVRLEYEPPTTGDDPAAKAGIVHAVLYGRRLADRRKGAPTSER